MAANSRFSVAIHVMTTLAYSSAEALTSDDLARSVNTNPVVIRRLLSLLRQGKLLICQAGKSGGCRLARPSRKISLYDIFQAVESAGPFAIPDKPKNKACVVSCNMKSILTSVFAQTEQAIAISLKRVALSDLLNDLRKASAS